MWQWTSNPAPEISRAQSSRWGWPVSILFPTQTKFFSLAYPSCLSVLHTTEKAFLPARVSSYMKTALLRALGWVRHSGHTQHPPFLSQSLPQSLPARSVVQFLSWTKGSDVVYSISPTLNLGPGHMQVLAEYTNVTKSMTPPLSGANMF